MTAEIALLLALLVAATVAFMLEWLTIDVVALAVVAVLTLTQILTPAEAFAAFASEVVVVLAAIFVLSGALVKTGIMEWLGEAIYRVGARHEAGIVGVVMGASAGLSAFLSNTNATAILMPAVLEYSKHSRLSPSRFLIPLAYASMLGGACTLIGTSTNLAASGLIERMGLRPIGVFELAPVGLTMAAVGIVWMVALGYRMLPRRAAASLGESFEIDRYVSEIVLEQGARLAGKRLADSGLAECGINVVAIVRDGGRVIPTARDELRAGDVLIVQASRSSLLELEEQGGLRFEAVPEVHDEDLASDEVRLAEAIVMPRSRLVGQTLKEMQFRHRFGISVLAVYRRGQSLAVEVGDVRLQAGDVMLLQGSGDQFRFLQSSRAIWVLGEVSRVMFRQRKGAIALAALAGAVAVSAAGWLPLSVAFLLAVLAVTLTRCVEPEELYRLVEWRVLVLIGGMTSFGIALENSGAADWLARLIAGATMPLGLWALLAAFVLLTMVLTQPMSNAAAALVVLPVAISTAAQVGVDPRSLAILVTLSASLSFIAPLEPACLLVYSPGKYRFRDFVVAGIPLTAIVFVVLMVLVPTIWPLR